jgi:hypothetical protein
VQYTSNTIGKHYKAFYVPTRCSSTYHIVHYEPLVALVVGLGKAAPTGYCYVLGQLWRCALRLLHNL